MDAVDRVPTVRSRDDHGVDVAPFEQLAIILVNMLGAKRLGNFLGSWQIDIGHGRVVCMSAKLPSQLTTPVPCPDRTEHNTIVRAKRFGWNQ